MFIFNFKAYNFKKYSFFLLGIVLLIGLISLFLLSKVQKENEDFVNSQIMGLALGFAAALFVSMVDYHFICKLYLIGYIVNLGLLFLVKFKGEEINYAKRWLVIAGIQFQPSELTKIFLIIFFAKILFILRERINSLLTLLIVCFLFGLPTIFVLLQPDLSTSMVLLFIFIVMVFCAGLSYKIIIPIIAIGIPLIAGLFWYVQQDYQILLKDYQQERVLSILNPEEHPDTMHQQENAIQAIGSGQLIGKAFDENAKETRGYTRVPIHESDFIFSVAGEELGFLGCVVIIILYLLIVFKCLITAKRAPDFLGALLAIGISAMFMFQVFVNIGVTTALLPNTGIPLPFLSKGLSSLMSSMIALGMILNIMIQQRKDNQEIGFSMAPNKDRGYSI